MAARSCGKVNAGTVFFSRPQFAVDIPSGHERQRLMMMPSAPTAHFVIAQARLALATLQTFLMDFPSRFGVGVS